VTSYHNLAMWQYNSDSNNGAVPHRSTFLGPLRYPDIKARGLQVPAFLLMTSQQIGRLQRVLGEAEGRNPAAVDAGTNSFHKSASGPAVPLEYHCSLFRMRVKDLTPEQFLFVPCPTCGVPAGNRCERYSGAPRNEPHVQRKLSATQASEKK